MAWNKRDWERWVHRLAKSSGCIKWSTHAQKQMRARKITMPVVLDVLRNGIIQREPEISIKTGFHECRMERFCAGRSVAVIVAIEEEQASSCLVVTTFVIGE